MFDVIPHLYHSKLYIWGYEKVCQTKYINTFRRSYSMKKVFAIFLVLALTLALFSGCSSKTGESGESSAGAGASTCLPMIPRRFFRRNKDARMALPPRIQGWFALRPQRFV
jgi:hypothetical protein